MKTFLAVTFLLLVPTLTMAAPGTSPLPAIVADAGGDRQSFVGKTISFNTAASQIPEGSSVREVLWDFGDGIRTTGDAVTHVYQRSGNYRVRLSLQTEQGTATSDATVQVFGHVVILIADSTATEETLQTLQDNAAKQDVYALVLRSAAGGTEVITEEDLTNQLLDAHEALKSATTLISWTSGSVGPNIWSKLAQHLRQNIDLAPLLHSFANKAVIIVSETPLAVLAPSAQGAYDQLHPSYIMLTRPAALPLLFTTQSPEELKNTLFTSSGEHRLLGAFSSRTVNDIRLTNFMSYGINLLVNRGVPINNITLLLMLPIIATILSFSRQVIGIKAFGIITPAMTTLSFLVMGLTNGLIVFSAVVISGTLTRLLMHRLHLLYLPRMALVLTSVSLAILLLLGVGANIQSASIVSFAIFPTLILTLLAEEFIAVQFKAGARAALTITAWTLSLAIACYFIMSWELLRTLIISYPEVVLLAIPINILLGRWTGLRLTEYFRFRKLLRHVL